MVSRPSSTDGLCVFDSYTASTGGGIVQRDYAMSVVEYV